MKKKPDTMQHRDSIPLSFIPRKRGSQTMCHLGGFTFIEVLVVVVILAMLASVVAVSLFAESDRARVKATQIQIGQLRSALALYRLHNAIYPDTKQGLEALLRKPGVGVVPKNWQGPYLTSKVLPSDGWSNGFGYTSTGGDYVIYSYGADGVEGGVDFAADITSDDF